jgi:hypothetical protein
MRWAGTGPGFLTMRKQAKNLGVFATRNMERVSLFRAGITPSGKELRKISNTSTRGPEQFLPLSSQENDN